jgi:signal transduction histidine kinase
MRSPFIFAASDRRTFAGVPALLVGALALGCGSEHATPVVIDADHDRWSLRSALTFFEDPDGALAPTEVANEPFELGSGSSSTTPVWVRIDVVIEDVSRPLYLSASPAHDDGILYAEVDGEWISSSFERGTNLVALPAPRAGPRFFLLRLVALTRAPDRFEIATLDGHVSAERTQFFLQGAYAGAALLVLLWNLTLLRRGRAHSAYVALVACNVAYFALRAGVVGSLFPQASGTLLIRVEIAVLVASVIAAVGFTRELFDAKRLLPRLDLALRAYLVMLAPFLLLAILGLARYETIRFVGLSFPLVALGTGFAALRRGSKSAAPYLVAWVCYLLGGLALAAPILPDGLPLTPGQIFQVGSALELASLSIALLVRLRDADVERTRAEQRAARSERLAALGQLAASVAHEVNNPNNLVTFNLPLLERYIDTLATASTETEHAARDARATVLDMKRAADRITRVVAQLKGHARPTGERARGDLNEVVRVAMAELRHAIPERVRVDVDLGPLPPFEMVAEALERVVVNLVTNAIEATARTSDARVRLVTRADSRGVRLEVIDNGPGVPEEIVDRLFTPFVTARPDASGTGLGLALSHETVREHRGTLDMRRGSGETIFTMRIPTNPELTP